MGVDITMNIIDARSGEIVLKNLYTGRNSDWFSNLNNHGYDFEYDYLPKSYGNEVPEVVKVSEDKLSENGYYGFSYIKVSDFEDWFLKYKPHLHAGWVSTYDKWRIEAKGYVPDEVLTFLESDARIEDYHFVEYCDEYDCSLYIYNKIVSKLNERDFDNLWIVYYFDR